MIVYQDVVNVKFRHRLRHGVHGSRTAGGQLINIEYDMEESVGAKPEALFLERNHDVESLFGHSRLHP